MELDNVSCLKLVECPIQGLCNQLYSLVGSITESHKNKKNILIVDNFLTEIWSNNYVPISSIIDLYITNIFLKKYNLCIVDSNDINFKLNKVLLGSDNKLLDISEFIFANYFNDEILKIPTDLNLLNIKGDPCEFVPKKIYIHYQVGYHNFCNTFDELDGYLKKDILINFKDLIFTNSNIWKTNENENEFNDIIKNLVFHPNYTRLSNQFINSLRKNQKTNVVHLRIETDGIKWWANQNNMSSKQFRSIIESKYIFLIQKYININDNIIILCGDENNKVIEFLKNNGYHFYLRKKDTSLGREINALIDLCIGEKCDNIFLAPIKCSTFSYTLKQRMKYPVNTICFSLNQIFEKANLDLSIEECTNTNTNNDK
jgi:hypothetical protein